MVSFLTSLFCFIKFELETIFKGESKNKVLKRPEIIFKKLNLAILQKLVSRFRHFWHPASYYYRIEFYEILYLLLLVLGETRLLLWLIVLVLFHKTFKLNLYFSAGFAFIFRAIRICNKLYLWILRIALVQTKTIPSKYKINQFITDWL